MIDFLNVMLHISSTPMDGEINLVITSYDLYQEAGNKLNAVVFKHEKQYKTILLLLLLLLLFLSL